MPDLECRLAKLEEKVTNKIANDKEDKEELMEIVNKIAFNVQTMREEKAKEKGFYGGVVFVIGGIATVASVVINKYL